MRIRVDECAGSLRSGTARRAESGACSKFDRTETPRISRLAALKQWDAADATQRNSRISQADEMTAFDSAADYPPKRGTFELQAASASKPSSGW
jgi:hypothetical protein